MCVCACVRVCVYTENSRAEYTLQLSPFSIILDKMVVESQNCSFMNDSRLLESINIIILSTQEGSEKSQLSKVTLALLEMLENTET